METPPAANASPPARPETAPSAAVHFPCLLTAVALMLIGSVYPLLLTNAQGLANHGLVMALVWSMSAGLVRGVGFVPRFVVWRWLFSGWACLAGLILAAWLRWGI